MVRAAFSSVLGVTLDGRPLSSRYAPLLVGGWIDQGVGVPAAFRLTFRDPRHLLLRDLGVDFGTEVVLTPIADGEGVGDPLLTGEVTGMETDYDGVGTFTVIRGYDPGHRLMRSRRVAAYRNQSAADIARRLAARDGVALGRIQPTRTVYDFISQSNVSDWDFLSRLADGLLIRRLRLALFDLRKKVQTALARQRQVQQNEIEVLQVKRAKTLLAIVRRLYGIAFERQQNLERLPNAGLIVDDKNASGCGISGENRVCARQIQRLINFRHVPTSLKAGIQGGRLCRSQRRSRHESCLRAPE